VDAHLSRFWFASIGVFSLITSPLAMISGDVGVGLLLLASAPFSGYEAHMKYRGGKFWH
jgi:hypothetical protein